MTVLTAQKAIDYVEHALSGPLASEIAPLDIVNQAGEHMFSFHSWNWTEGGVGTVSFVQDQAYAALPTDLQSITAIDKSEALVTHFELVSKPILLNLKTSQVSPTSFATYGCVTYAGTPVIPRLEIWPTPSAAATDVLTLYYRTGWAEISVAGEQDTTTINIPTWCHDLFYQLCRAFAQGYEEGQIEQRLAMVEVGPSCMRAKRRDGLGQPHYGQISGGAVQVQYGGRRNPYRVQTAGGPS